MGSDQYQIRSARAIVHFWALSLCVYQYLDEQRRCLQREHNCHVTMGQARTCARKRHADLLLEWISLQFRSGASTDKVRSQLKPALA